MGGRGKQSGGRESLYALFVCIASSPPLARLKNPTTSLASLDFSPVKKKGLPGRRTSCPPICCLCVCVYMSVKFRKETESCPPSDAPRLSGARTSIFSCKSWRSTHTHTHSLPFGFEFDSFFFFRGEAREENKVPYRMKKKNVKSIEQRGGERAQEDFMRSPCVRKWTGSSCGCCSCFSKKEKKKKKRRRGWTATLGKSGKV